MLIGLIKAPDKVLSFSLLMWRHAERVHSDSKCQPVLNVEHDYSPVYTVDVNDRNHFREADNQKGNRTGKVVKKG